MGKFKKRRIIYGKKKEKSKGSWRKRRALRAQSIKNKLARIHYFHSSILMHIFARKKKRDESIEEYRLKAIGLEFIELTIVITIIIGLFYWI